MLLQYWAEQNYLFPAALTLEKHKVNLCGISLKELFLVEFTFLDIENEKNYV